MKKSALIFTLLFLFVIFALPVTQAVYEVTNGKRIQFFDLFEDTFATPVKRANTMHLLVTRILARVDSVAAEVGQSPTDSAGAWDSQREQGQTDEAMVDAAELRKTVLTYNRHVKAPETSKSVAAITLYQQSLDSLMASLRDGNRPASARILASLRESTSQLAAHYPKADIARGAILIVKNLPVIFWNAKYLRPYEKEIENTSIFTTSTRPVMFFLKYVLYQDLGEKGVLGKNGWFFYKQDVDYLIRPYVLDRRSLKVDPNDVVVSDNPIQAAVTFKRQLAEFGVDLLVAVIPGKPSIYPDMLAGNADPRLVAGRGNSRKAIDDLRASGVEAIDLFSPFLAERANDSIAGDSMYLSKDTHWRARGLRTAAHVVAERIKQYPWYRAGATEYALDSTSIDRIGDVGVMTTLPAVKVHELSVSFPIEKTKCYQVYQVERDDKGTETGRHLYKDDPKNAQVVLIGDSFSRIYQSDEPRSAGWISHIALELKQPITSIVSDGGASTLVREQLSRKTGLLKGKKLVVWEVVERDFRYGNEGWKDVPLTVATK
jgi:SGNH hydrolase-like domain, acetyltransferase AlgX